jgi:hypothetical protein
MPANIVREFVVARQIRDLATVARWLDAAANRPVAGRAQLWHILRDIVMKECANKVHHCQPLPADAQAR